MQQTPLDSSRKPVIGQVGVGGWGKLILRDLVALGCEVHVVARSESSIANAHEFGAASVVATIDELPELDGAIAASLATSHAAVVLALAEAQAGPIYCEKPLTADVTEAEQLVGSVGDRVFVMDKWRYQAGILELARLTKSGEIGEFQSLTCTRVSTRNPHADVNTLWTHMPHDLSIALEIVGDVPPVTHAVGEFVGRALIGTHATFGDRPWVSVEVSDAASTHHRETRVVASEGVAILAGGWSEEVLVRRFDGEPDQVIEAKGELPLLAELRAFVDHVQGGPPPKSSATEGLLIVRRIAEVIELVEQGRPQETLA